MIKMPLRSRGKELRVGSDTDLGEFTRTLHDRYHSDLKGDLATRRVVSMLGYLYDERKPSIVPKQVHTIGGLYSFTQEDILMFRNYRKKTWLRLNELLVEYGLPPLKLPQEYTSRS